MGVGGLEVGAHGGEAGGSLGELAERSATQQQRKTSARLPVRCPASGRYVVEHIEVVGLGRGGRTPPVLP